MIRWSIPFSIIYILYLILFFDWYMLFVFILGMIAIILYMCMPTRNLKILVVAIAFIINFIMMYICLS